MLPLGIFDQIIRLLDVKKDVACIMRVNSVFQSLAEKKLYHEVQIVPYSNSRNDILCDTLMKRTSAAEAVRIARIAVRGHGSSLKELVPRFQSTIRRLTNLATIDAYIEGQAWGVLCGLGHDKISTVILAGACETNDDYRAIQSFLFSSKNVQTLCDFRRPPILFSFPPEVLPNLKRSYGQCYLLPEEPFSALVNVTLFSLLLPLKISWVALLKPCFGNKLECFRISFEWTTGSILEILSALNPLILRELCITSAIEEKHPCELELVQDLTANLPRFTKLRTLELPKPRIINDTAEKSEAAQVTSGPFSDESTALNFLRTLIPALETMTFSALEWKYCSHSNVYVPKGSLTASLPLS